MSKENWGVHISHCCILHGCKYGDKDCPVKLGYVKQEYTCEDCDYDGIESLEDVDREVKKEKIKNFVEENKCPHCGDTGGKHILKTKPEMTFMWCYNCQKHFNIVYKRIAVDLILD